MRYLFSKFSKILILFIVVLLLVILFVDNESLNSLFINYENDLLVQEFTILEVDYDEVIYNHTQNNSQVTSVNHNSATTNNTSSTNTSSSSTSLVNKVASMDYWAWPTEGNYTITTYYSNSHKAIDVYKGYASNIYAANNGVVTSVKGGCIVGDLTCNGRGGNYVVINHKQSNYYTVYMHLKDIRVKVGDVVSRGQVIGTMGNTGNVIPAPTSSAPYLGTHLHFGLYIGEPYNGGYAVNPMRLY